MPEPVALDARPAAAVLARAAIGCDGKIPSRGDFVRLGLPRDFADRWDAWITRMLAASRARLGVDWLAAWLEAPIWRFALAPGVCGAGAALGLWMASVDRVGRYFPLTLAAIVPDADPGELVRDGGGFLAAAEVAGLDTIDRDLTPDSLLARLAAAAAEPPGPAGVEIGHFQQPGALWWTEGSARVPAGAIPTPALPDEASFIAMLNASFGGGS